MSAAALLGVLTAALFATGVTVSRLGMRTVDPTTGVYWSVLATTSTLGLLVLFRGGPGTLTIESFLLVAAAGLVASVIGRFSSFQGALRLGPSRSVAVQSSTYPIMSVVGGLVLFRETLTPLRALGVALLLLSVRAVVVDLRGAKGAADAPAAPVGVAAVAGPAAAGGPAAAVRLRGRAALVFPLASGMAYGGADLFRKAAVDIGADPLTAAFAGIVVALVVWSGIVARRSGVRTLVTFEKDVRWYLMSGVFSAFAVLCSFLALRLGDASVVGPLIATQPVFVAVASALLLGQLEKRTLRTFVAVGLVTVGAVILGRFG